MMIGDVRGKGMQAVALVNALMGAFHGSALHRPDLPDVVRDLEAQIQSAKNREDGEAGESFATAIVAETSRDHSVLRLANRGHPTPLLVHAGKAIPLEPEVPSLPLGLADLGGPDAPVDEYELPPGGMLVTFTDGVIEARDRSGVFFDPVPALARRLPPDPEAVLDAMLVALAGHAEELEDDTAALALTRVPTDGDGRDLSTAASGD
ncbi:PP2C family protein-serine/threonine phosphatase [Streptomyces pristinaespiralis]|uniref:PP2C family protein-serine/threonine phosphatase n=1 Tax=Streptomyces pristinaespiralis TaxID=38300 RepID=UPI0037947BB3